MKYLRRIRPLCWFMLIWMVFISYHSWPYTLVGRSALFNGLLLIHLGIYWVGLSLKLAKKRSWLFLFIQAVCVLTLYDVSQSAPVAGTLTIALLIAALDVLKQRHHVLIAVGSYIGLFLIYTLTLEHLHPLSWQALWHWTDGGPGDYMYLALFLLASVVFYLQQEGAHKHTQTLLRDQDSTHEQLNATHQQLNKTHDQLATYMLRVEELTALTERQHLARELHDTLSQGLAGLVMQLDAANTYFGQDKGIQAQEVVQRAMSRARTMLTETRYVINDLRAGPPRPDDLPELVQEESERFTQMTGTPCETELAALAHTPADNCEHVLRTITEGLTNIARHAQAHQVHIQTAIRDALIEIEISDDGIGFDPATVENKSGHYGLIGLRERARLIGGEFDIQSVSGAGTRMRLRVPCQVEIGITI